MKICAVICEYDPFHLGHKYQIEKLKSEGYSVVAIMSGSFTQRGSAAIISKYFRAESAICSGADLVLELPFPYCSGGASKFAEGAVALTSRLGCIDTLAFGSECGDTDLIIKTAENLLSDKYENAVAERAAGGERYADISSSVYAELFGESQVFSGSNDLLAVEYVKALLRRKSGIAPLAVKRVGQSFNDTSGEGFFSASAVREVIRSGDFSKLDALIPEESVRLIRSAAESGSIADTDRLFPAYASFFRLTNSRKLENFTEMNGELASRICSAAGTAGSLSELIGLAKTKRYSDSRIRRAMLFSVLGIRDGDFSEPCFSVLLGASARGREILSEINKKSTLEIITKPADYIKCTPGTIKQFGLLLRAEALWTLALGMPRGAGYNMRFSPYIGG